MVLVERVKLERIEGNSETLMSIVSNKDSSSMFKCYVDPRDNAYHIAKLSVKSKEIVDAIEGIIAHKLEEKYRRTISSMESDMRDGAEKITNLTKEKDRVIHILKLERERVEGLQKLESRLTKWILALSTVLVIMSMVIIAGMI